MAKLSADKTYVTVEKGDNLWNIARDYLGDGTKWKTLAAINDVPTSNLIMPGDKIYLKKQTSTTPTKKKASTNKAVIKKFGLQASVENSLFATWTWDKNYTDNYKVQWRYYPKGAGDWFMGEDSTTDYKFSIYSIPQNATRVSFRVKPIAKKHKVKTKKGKKTVETEEYRWKAEWTSFKIFNVSAVPPSTPTSPPEVTIAGTKLTAKLSNLDTSITSCEFEVVRNDNKRVNTGTAKVTKRAVSYTCSIQLGYNYKVRYRAIKDKLKSGWSDYSSNSGTAPATPKEIIVIKALSETSVQLDWTNVSNATGYTVEYTTKQYYFNSSSEVGSMTVDAKVAGHAEVTNLTSGERYYFRVKATNDNGESGWCPVKSIVIGKKPSAPTTWSSLTTAIAGEDVNLYWVHNSEDGSSQTYAQLELTYNGKTETKTIQNKNTGDNIDKTSVYTLSTASITTTIKWRVRTRGILNEYGDWSIQRSIDIYEAPTLDLIVYKTSPSTSSNTIGSFPFYISAEAGPSTQKPISYHLSIASDDYYETVDNVGNPKVVMKGDVVYSKNFDTSDKLLVEMSAGNIDLESGMSYIVTCTVSMNSGLTAEAYALFLIDWDEAEYLPNAEIGIDPDTYTAIIRPYCEGETLTYYKVSESNGIYRKTTEVITEDLYEEDIGAKTITGEDVFRGTTDEGTELYFCVVTSSSLIEDVSLAVYRRDFDGGFTEIASGLDGGTYVTDPHPALDYARYRIVATTASTGTVSYYDVPAEVVGGISVVIQWDEQWSNFIAIEDDENPMDEPSWSGSMLLLPYNIDVSDKYSPDVELVEYIGRKHPVSYYGTQRGESSTWNVEIDKTDEETIYALRRLATWPGDVYVREPSGSGYWAHVVVSFSQKHLELTIPVTLDITRVEGGI